MSPQTIRILIAGALLVHGVGHTLGYWRPATTILFFKAPEAFLKITGGAIWTAAAIGFILAFMSFSGILVPAGWWRPLAIVFAVISLVGLVLFGRSWPISNFIGAFGLNIVILVALLWLHWPPINMFNR